MRKRILTLIALCLTSIVFVKAQEKYIEMPTDTTSSYHKTSFLEKLLSDKEQCGRVRIYQDHRITEKIGSPGKNLPENIVLIDEKPYLEMMGFRIQIFSGNHQATAKSEAFQKEAAVKAKMPELTTYMRYSAPFWRVRVGDFITYEEAYEVLLRLKKTFVFGREMSIVREKITIPL